MAAFCKREVMLTRSAFTQQAGEVTAMPRDLRVKELQGAIPVLQKCRSPCSIRQGESTGGRWLLCAYCPPWSSLANHLLPPDSSFALVAPAGSSSGADGEKKQG